MPAQLDVYNLGQLGVNVDKSPVHLDDNELVTAQNVVQNKQGVAGGLVNRPSLTKYDTDVAAGSIPGAICAPLGPGPGATTDDVVNYYLAYSNSPYWRTSSNSFSTNSTTTTLARLGTQDIHASAMLGGRLYYTARTDGDNQTIRVFDGAQDRRFVSLASGYQVVNIVTLKGYIYLLVIQGSSAAYVYKINTSGQIRQVGAALPTAIVEFHALAYHNNDLYVSGNVNGVAGKVYRIREKTALETTAWTLDYTAPVAAEVIYSLISFNGLLHAGLGGQGGTVGSVLQRSQAGVYTVVDTTNTAYALPETMIEFRGNLYVWWNIWDGTNSRIRKTSDGTTWSTSYNAGAFSQYPSPQFYNTGNKLFVIFRQNSGLIAGKYSIDGTNWTTFSLTGTDYAKHGFGWFRL